MNNDGCLSKVERQIIPEFDNHLIGKPKLFIFQACRGSQGNLRPDPTSSTGSGWSSDNVTHVDGGNYTTTQVPMRRDMAIWYSTIRGTLFTHSSEMEKNHFFL